MDQAEIEERFRREGLTPMKWSNGPGDKYAEHSHNYRKVLYCVSGSITFFVEGKSIELQPGGRLDLDPATRHSAIVGPDGVVCMEAHIDD